MKQIAPITDEEMQALVNLLDAGVKTMGLNSVNAAARWLQLINGATEVVDEPEMPPKAGLPDPAFVDGIDL